MARPKKEKKPMPEDKPVPPPTPDEERQNLKTDVTAKQGRESETEPKLRREEILRDMMRSIITEPLLSQVQQDPTKSFEVIIALNELFSGGLPGALQHVKERADKWNVRYTTLSHYVFACLTGDLILKLAGEARELTLAHGKKGTVVYRIWQDTEISITLTKSLTTVKADAAQRAFAARGEGIVWAVLDSGVHGKHPHFQGDNPIFGPYDTFSVQKPLVHLDFTPDGAAPELAPGENPTMNPSALEDRLGHGTHVCGIIAGYWQSESHKPEKVVGAEMRNEANPNDRNPITMREELRTISGVAPLCKILSLKVIADVSVPGKQSAGSGKVSWILKAIDQIQRWNENGKQIQIHGVNMSLGYDFNPRWFACGQSPICVEVNRLVRNGVSVVVSAGNAGYGSFVMASTPTNTKAEEKYSNTSITDPGNADLAITVGSTHREKPHTYGVSYFSSRGPTGDGRLKPDLLAPGERIISCAAGLEAAKYGGDPGKKDEDGQVLFCELSGTSMAAPHVSGAIAAFLSVRSEFIGEPERVKEIFLANTIDLHRERAFQGAGLLDLMKVLQAV